MPQAPENYYSGAGAQYVYSNAATNPRPNAYHGLVSVGSRRLQQRLGDRRGPNRAMPEDFTWGEAQEYLYNDHEVHPHEIDDYMLRREAAAAIYSEKGVEALGTTGYNVLRAGVEFGGFYAGHLATRPMSQRGGKMVRIAKGLKEQGRAGRMVGGAWKSRRSLYWGGRMAQAGALAAGELLWPIAAGMALESGARYVGVGNALDQFREMSELRALSPEFTARGLTMDPEGRMSREMSQEVNSYLQSYARGANAYTEYDLSANDLKREVAMMTEAGIISDVRDAEDFERQFSSMREGLLKIVKTLGKSYEEAAELIGEMKQLNIGGPEGANLVEQARQLSVGAGIDFDVVHQSGLRGALGTMGTGLSAEVGYTIGARAQTGAQSVYEQDLIDSRTRHTLGGLRGMEETLQRLPTALSKSRFGKIVAFAASEGGELNRDRLMDIVAGNVNPYDILSQATPGTAREFLQDEASVTGVMNQIAEMDPALLNGIMMQMANQQLQQFGIEDPTEDEITSMMVRLAPGAYRNASEAKLAIAAARARPTQRARQQLVDARRGRVSLQERMERGNRDYLRRAFSRSPVLNMIRDQGRVFEQQLSRGVFNITQGIRDRIQYETEGTMPVDVTATTFAAFENMPGFEAAQKEARGSYFEAEMPPGALNMSGFWPWAEQRRSVDTTDILQELMQAGADREGLLIGARRSRFGRDIEGFYRLNEQGERVGEDVGVSALLEMENLTERQRKGLETLQGQEGQIRADQLQRLGFSIYEESEMGTGLFIGSRQGLEQFQQGIRDRAAAMAGALERRQDVTLADFNDEERRRLDQAQGELFRLLRTDRGQRARMADTGEMYLRPILEEAVEAGGFEATDTRALAALMNTLDEGVYGEQISRLPAAVDIADVGREEYEQSRDLLEETAERTVRALVSPEAALDAAVAQGDLTPEEAEGIKAQRRAPGQGFDWGMDRRAVTGSGQVKTYKQMAEQYRKQGKTRQADVLDRIAAVEQQKTTAKGERLGREVALLKGEPQRMLELTSVAGFLNYVSSEEERLTGGDARLTPDQRDRLSKLRGVRQEMLKQFGPEDNFVLEQMRRSLGEDFMGYDPEMIQAVVQQRNVLPDETRDQVGDSNLSPDERLMGGADAEMWQTVQDMQGAQQRIVIMLDHIAEKFGLAPSVDHSIRGGQGNRSTESANRKSGENYQF